MRRMSGLAQRSSTVAAVARGLSKLPGTYSKAFGSGHGPVCIRNILACPPGPRITSLEALTNFPRRWHPSDHTIPLASISESAARIVTPSHPSSFGRPQRMTKMRPSRSTMAWGVLKGQSTSRLRQVTKALTSHPIRLNETPCPSALVGSTA